MATNTYVELDKVTVGTATPSVTFTGISGSYTDLVIVANIRGSANTFNNMNYPLITFNGDTAANYSATIMFERYYGAQQTLGDRSSGQNNMNMGAIAGPSHSSSIFSTYTLNVANYANTNTYKACLARISTGGGLTDMQGVTLGTGLWKSTSAITSVTFTASSSGNFAVGSTLSLYGIRAEGVSPAPKATGGAISSDSTYYYHTFGASGTFTPLQSLTCDYVVVAGGGGAGGGNGGGGGAGGLRSTFTATGGGGSLETPLSLTATGYTVTIGAGGAGSNGIGQGTTGSNSVFSTITSTAGGGGGGGSNNSAGLNGGSGGGGTSNNGAGGTRVTGQGFAGGAGGPTGAGGGGGGAGAVGGTAPNGSDAGNGGAGVAVLLAGNSTYFAGGGGGHGSTPGLGGIGGGGAGSISGIGNTGGGGGGWNGSAVGSGGSGVVIVRYAKV